MWRIAHVNAAGVLLLLTGIDILSISSFAWICYGREDLFGVRSVAEAVSVLLVLIGLGVFACGCRKGQQYGARQIVIGLLVLFFLAIRWFAIPPLGNAAVVQRRTSDCSANSTATRTAVVVVESCRKLGKYPDAETLKEMMRGKSLPSVRWDGYYQPIQYQRTSDTAFQLRYIDPSQLWQKVVIYDSAMPDNGWYQIAYKDLEKLRECP